MNKAELQKRVDKRKQELATEKDRLSLFKEKIIAFVNDIKSRSAVYALIKNLKIWKELEELAKEADSNAD